MSDSERLVKFNLLGQDFTFYTGASEEELDRILKLVRQQVEDGSAESQGSVPLSKLALLGCLNLASRYVRLKKEYQTYRVETGERIESLNEKIAQSLGSQLEEKD